jgi:arginyl-tRNA synthetase
MPEAEFVVPAPAALREALQAAVVELGAPAAFVALLDRPGDSAHGDLTTNAALVLAGMLKRPPREIASEIAARLSGSTPGVASVEVAGPGFLNFRLEDRLVWTELARVASADQSWGRCEADAPERVNVEFVSANPTGPLHVAHGRGAAIGDVVASLLEWTGHQVEREYYVNDAGRQIELLGLSIDARLRQATGEQVDVPEGGYQGAYIAELAATLEAEQAPVDLSQVAGAERIRDLSRRASDALREDQAADLKEFGVRFDNWFSESQLFGAGEVKALLSDLETREAAYRDEGALWLRTTQYGDEKDRVLVKGDGSHTYFVSDIAYHLDKRTRGFDRAIDVWGADHHGHVLRMKAALEASSVDPDFLEVIIIQLVTVMRGGEEVRMS